MTELTPGKRLAQGHATSQGDEFQRNRVAGSYNPAHDVQAEHIRSLGDRMTPSLRIALGHHDNAKAAAEANEQEQNQ